MTVIKNKLNSNSSYNFKCSCINNFSKGFHYEYYRNEVKVICR